MYVAALLVAAAIGPLLVAAILLPQPIDWRHARIKPRTLIQRELAGRQDSERGRNEVEFLAQYEPLQTDATSRRGDLRAARNEAPLMRDFRYVGGPDRVNEPRAASGDTSGVWPARPDASYTMAEG